MPAEVERQRVAIMGKRSWEEFRAVCRDHGVDNTVAQWMGEKTHPNWIDAKLDAAAHNREVHPRAIIARPKTWAEIIDGSNAEAESPILPNLSQGQHLGPVLR